MADLIQLRRDTTENWETVNPILADGEIGLITDDGNGLYKLGNGVSRWSQLPMRGLDNDSDGNIDAGRADTKYGGCPHLNLGGAR